MENLPAVGEALQYGWVALAAWLARLENRINTQDKRLAEAPSREELQHENDRLYQKLDKLERILWQLHTGQSPKLSPPKNDGEEDA